MAWGILAKSNGVNLKWVDQKNNFDLNTLFLNDQNWSGKWEKLVTTAGKEIRKKNIFY